MNRVNGKTFVANVLGTDVQDEAGAAGVDEVTEAGGSELQMNPNS